MTTHYLFSLGLLKGLNKQDIKLHLVSFRGAGKQVYSLLVKGLGAFSRGIYSIHSVCPLRLG